MTVYLQMDLEDKLDHELSLDLFYDHPTVDALSAISPRSTPRAAA